MWSVGTSVTQILLGGGVSVSDTYRIWIRPGYASDTFLAVSWKNGYVFAWIRVSDTFGPDGIQPEAVISPPKCCFGSKRWIDDTKWWTCCNRTRWAAIEEPLMESVVILEKASYRGNVIWTCKYCTSEYRESYSRVKSHLLNIYVIFIYN